MSQEHADLGNEHKILVVLLHAYTGTPKSLDAVKSAVMRSRPVADIHCPLLPAGLASVADPNQIVQSILHDIDMLCATRVKRARPYQRIIFVGHSLGALLARKAYVVACGETSKAPFEDAFRAGAVITPSGLVAARPWAAAVDRIILLAGMNRGWRITHHLDLVRAPVWAVGAAAGHILRLLTHKTLLIATIRQGAEFITQLRIQWICMRQAFISEHNMSNPGQPVRTGGAVTIQLLGSRDDIVSPEDNIDLVSGGDFFYIDVPHSGHVNIVELDDPQHGAERLRLFEMALAGTMPKIRAQAIVPSDENFSSPDLKVRHVAFVIHGIRDAGYWTHKIARRIKRRSGSDIHLWATETSSYGYFPMLPFLFPWYRRKKVEWLMDQYAQALARYPNAKFYYVGHSNGTYLIAKALQLYRCCRFENIVFAGSVVSRFYDWHDVLQSNPPRANAILNLVASRDWVVAFFPKAFQTLRLQDLGSAGHDGFVTPNAPTVYERSYIDGGHATAVGEELWDVIADFILTGQPPSQGTIPKQISSQSLVVRTLGRYPPLIWVGIASIVLAVWFLIRAAISSTSLAPMDEGIATGVAATLYCASIWFAVTRL